MNIVEASTLARRLMNEHGLGHIPFEFDRGRKRLAATHFEVETKRVVKITLSHHFASLLSEFEIEQCILHEIAHARAGFDAGHGPSWSVQARAVGAADKRCMAPSARPEAAWQYVCPNGHRSAHGQHRAPLRVKSCTKCSPKFNPDFILKWTKNGKTVPFSEMPVRYRQERETLMLRGLIKV